MRVIIAGGRDVMIETGVLFVEQAIQESGFEITELINGGASGIDAAAREFWKRKFCDQHPKYPLKTIHADWQKYGKAAGPIRNQKMAEQADALIAIWDGRSRGTKNMIETAQRMGLIVFVFYYESL